MQPSLNKYESPEFRLSSSPSQIEEHLNTWLDEQGVFQADPLERMHQFYKKNKQCLFQKNNSMNSITETGFSFENLPTNNTISEGGIGTSKSIVSMKDILRQPSIEEGSMVLKGVDSFRLVRRRKMNTEIGDIIEEKKE